jgi:uncharacterized membrane protein
MKRLLVIAILSVFFLPVGTVIAQNEVHQDLQEVVTATVAEIMGEEDREIEGTDTTVHVQYVEARLTSGSRVGQKVTFENEIVVLEKGDEVYLNFVKTINGDEYYYFKDFKRHTQLILLTLLFIGILILFARWQGVRALLSLALSIGAILFVLVPAIFAGFDPVLVSLAVSGAILALVLFMTHGIHPRSVIALLGTFSAVVATCLIAWLCVSSMRLTGFGHDAAVSLNFATKGALDFGGLLLGSIIIGILGVLDDVSITQASVVQELKHANKNFKALELYTRAIKVGKDHIGSLVNTLALAYVGVSLPLVLLFARADATLGLTLNQEVVAAELVRIIVGSIGLILAVPITTAIAAWWYGKHDIDEHEVSSHGHSHTH